MKIECVQDKLKEVLSQAEKISGKNLNLPVLSCLLFEAKKGEILIKSTNLDLGFQSSIPAKVEEMGVVAVPAATLSAFVENISNEKNIKISTNENVFFINTTKNKAVIKCLPHEDFPTIPELPKDQSFEIKPNDFIKGLKAVFYSSSISSIKPELSSVFIFTDDLGLVFTATDSFRLAEKKIKTGNIKDFDHILIPFKNINEIIRVLEKTEEAVKVYLNKNQIAFTFGSTHLTSRLIDGTFPDYRQIIPKEFKTEAVVLKEDLLQSLKIANIFSDKFNQVGISVNPKEKKFEISTKNGNLGENTSSVTGALTGESTESNFNYRYITDCLQSIDSDSVSLSFAGQGKPVVIRGVSDRSFTYLVMPMNR